MNEPAVDPAAFAHLLEITGDDLEFVDELIDTYLEDAAAQIAAMTAAAAANDAAAMERPAHTLKSSSANVGAIALSEACRTLEADGRAGSVPDAVARVAACAKSLDAVRSELLAARAAR